MSLCVVVMCCVVFCVMLCVDVLWMFCFVCFVFDLFVLLVLCCCDLLLIVLLCFLICFDLSCVCAVLVMLFGVVVYRFVVFVVL